MLREMGTPLLIHQPKYSILERWVEDGLLDVVGNEGIGLIPFSPLAQGLLTNKYLKEIPEGSRAAKPSGFLKKEQITNDILSKIGQLNDIALKRGQSLAQMAIAWLLKDERVTSVLVGVSSKKQLLDNLGSLNNLAFSKEELNEIQEIL
jgi:L-glyceraldehyde 3-phosphate reductase